MMSAIIIAAILVIATFIFAAVSTAKARKQARILIEQIEMFAAKISQGEIVLYSDDSSDTTLIGKDGKSVPILEEEFKAAGKRCRIVLQGLAVGSNVPDKCYRVAFKGFEFEHDKYGQPTGFVVLYFQPAQCCEDWRVQKFYKCFFPSYITCRHPVMGIITVEDPKGNDYFPKQWVKLHQYVEETPSGQNIVNYKIG